MKKNKIVSSILAGLSLCLFLGPTIDTFAVGNNIDSNSFYYDYISIKNVDDFETIEILGDKYDLSKINSAVLQSVAKIFDKVNSEKLTEVEKNNILKDAKELLDEYIAYPSKFENYPVTLDLGPSTMLREEILFVQNKIESLKQEQELIKNTKISQKFMDEKINEIQMEIDKICKWINKSVFTFTESEYKKTFIKENIYNDESESEILLTHVYTSLDYDNLFKISVDSKGKFIIDKDLNIDLTKIIYNGLEFENSKLRNLYLKLETLINTEMDKNEKDIQIRKLKKEIESVKAYGLSQEIILLNIEKNSVMKTMLPQEVINKKVKEIDEDIFKKVSILKEFKENLNNNQDFFIENSELGKRASYFGYSIQDDGGFGVKVSITEDNRVLIDNIKISDNQEVTLDILNHEQKNILKNVLNVKILEAKDRMFKLEGLKDNLNKGDENYYFADSIDKEIVVLNNDIKNYEFISSKL